MKGSDWTLCTATLYIYLIPHLSFSPTNQTKASNPIDIHHHESPSSSSLRLPFILSGSRSHWLFPGDEAGTGEPHIREIEVFAISEYNRQESKNITLIQVVKGEQQLVAGTNYRLTLLVKDGGSSTAKYETIVYEPLKGSKQLMSFQPLVLVGGWTPIKDVTDPHIGQVAEFAVSEHNKKAKTTHLTLVRVVEGKTQVVSGIDYKLALEAKDKHGVSGKYVAVVWEKAWENFVQLTSFHALLKS